MKKGLTLPVNAVVIIVIAALVLGGIIYFYRSGWQPTTGGVTQQAAKDSACLELVNRGCGIEDTINVITDNFDADGDGVIEPGGGVWDLSLYGWPAGRAGTDFTDNIAEFKKRCCDPSYSANCDDNLLSLCLCKYDFAEIVGTAPRVDAQACLEMCGC